MPSSLVHGEANDIGLHRMRCGHIWLLGARSQFALEDPRTFRQR